jgi:hypothetical protein
MAQEREVSTIAKNTTRKMDTTVSTVMGVCRSNPVEVDVEAEATT